MPSGKCISALWKAEVRGNKEQGNKETKKQVRTKEQGNRETREQRNKERTCHLASVYWHFGSPRSVGTPREIDKSLGPRKAPSRPWTFTVRNSMDLICQVEYKWKHRYKLWHKYSPQGLEWNPSFQLPLSSLSLQIPDLKKIKRWSWTYVPKILVAIFLPGSR